MDERSWEAPADFFAICEVKTGTLLKKIAIMLRTELTPKGDGQRQTIELFPRCHDVVDLGHLGAPE